ncbi:hybrid sensor histidine kinase/response regulator [Arcticibacter eurypsychrophilus]|uniref:hybrid sensor histidine kinase/response regulator n=1 Tax=Arcticibacter eurypsychrophilus TaxID=1434752 RepID=UPI00084E0363|nr:hybrid sensor histidine kinase/response regulator [Arcticibacter eurypsychrophilus]
MAEKIKILYIDDEPDNLVGFKASFRFDYQVFIAENAVAAYLHLKNYPDIRIVFCDQRMPDQTGVELFDEMRSLYPSAVRILLTGYTDVESIIDAINKGNIFRFVKKPWAEIDIISAIEEANKFFISNYMLAVKHEELQRAYSELDKFAYSVSHDIRGPLSGILGAINVARVTDDVEGMKEVLGMMEKSLENLDNYIVNMHEYHSLQRGELQIKEIDFKEVASGLKNIYQVIAETSNISFVLKIDQSEPFYNDEGPIQLILNNLLSNAFKYQEKDKSDKVVELSIEVNKEQATFQISDNGIGILRNHINEIFNLFYRATSQSTGSGFGLYNVKSAILKLNGHIEVSSVLNRGTTFKVIIPSK